MHPEYLIVFDGECILCNRFVQSILKHDRKGQFYFCTFQKLPQTISRKGLQQPLQESVSYLRKQQWHQKSTAILLINRDLSGRWHWSQLGWFVPRFLRDICYVLVAKNRYKWFGKRASCYIPNKAERARFIE